MAVTLMVKCYNKNSTIIRRFEVGSDDIYRALDLASDDTTWAKDVNRVTVTEGLEVLEAFWTQEDALAAFLKAIGR